MPTKLSVNVNKIATLRNTRPLEIPSIVHLARIALESGAHGITIHPRPDQRHIRTADVDNLAALWKSFRGTEFNIEGNPFYDYMPHIRAVRPTQCTLVPDAPEASTSNAGWNLTAENVTRLRPLIDEMKSLGCRVSLFMDAGSQQLKEAADVGADRIELYTEPYAVAYQKTGGSALALALNQFADTAARARAAGLKINAGHDLNLNNLGPFLKHVSVEEVSIGHALIADALEFGMAETIRRYLAACQS